MDRIRREMNYRTVHRTFLKGIIEADETYIGVRSQIQGRGTTKTAVLGAVERNGKVVARVIRTADSETIREFVTRYIPEPDESRFITDGLNAYRAIGDYISHDVITRNKGYFRGDVHTNTIESVWAILKRARFGVHHSYRATTILNSTLARCATDLPPSMCPHPELGYGCGERFGDRFRCRWAIAQ